ncbi:MAG: hypothetical protein KKA60_03435 [Proteobacteria bacterium]|nr:hypothetical protein [Pseudomonadota bacterium]
MKKGTVFLMGALLAAALLAGPSALAGDKPEAPAPNPPAVAAPAPEGGGEVITINNLTIDKKNKEIRLAVRTAIDHGVLEYFAVGDVGKTYESVFKIADTKPSDLNFALLLLGFAPMDFDAFQKAAAGEGGLAALAAEHPDSLLSIEIQKDGKTVDPYALIKDREGKNSPMVWVFTGGYFRKDGRYAPDWIWNFAAIWPDPASVLNLFSNQENPYRSNGGLMMNEAGEKLETDIPYTLVLRRRQP